MSTISVDNFQGLTSNVISLSSSQILYAPGHVIQVATAYKTDTQTISAGATFVDITGLSVIITPRKTNSKFLIHWSVSMGNGTDASHGYVRIDRNGTIIGNADASSNRTPAVGTIVNTGIGGQSIPSTGFYLDSPATLSEITYKLKTKSNEVGGTTYINRSLRDNDASGYDGRGTSSLVVMEVAA